MNLANWIQTGFDLKWLGDGGTTDMFTASGSGTSEYYYNQTDLKHKPLKVYEGTTELTEGTLGSLSASEWAYGDNDSIGGDRLYVRTSGSVDPDTLLTTARINCTDAYTVVTAGATTKAILLSQKFSISDECDLQIIHTDASDVVQMVEEYSFAGADTLTLDEKIVVESSEKLKVQASIVDINVYISGAEA